MSEFDDHNSALPSRRALIGAAAWSVPVVAVVTATPAFAASSPPASVSLLSPRIQKLRASWSGRQITGITANLMIIAASSTQYATLIPFTWTLTVSGPAGQATVKSGSDNVSQGATWKSNAIDYSPGTTPVPAGNYTFTLTVTVSGSGSRSTNDSIAL